jgi:hypothetical protein
MLDRYLYKEGNTDMSPVSQSIEQSPSMFIDTINTPDYMRTAEFPQPSVIGLGYVTSAGAVDTAKFFFSQNWTVAKNSTGNYTITHNIGYATKYLPIFNLIGTTDKSFAVTVNANTTDIVTFNQAGTATDTAFMFVFYLIA